MDLTQLANLGEFIGGVGSLVGAFAVLATLIYLAMQVRQNTSAEQRKGQKKADPEIERLVALELSSDERYVLVELFLAIRNARSNTGETRR